MQIGKWSKFSWEIDTIRQEVIYLPLAALIKRSKYTDLSCLLAKACLMGGIFIMADRTAAIARWLPNA